MANKSRKSRLPSLKQSFFVSFLVVMVGVSLYFANSLLNKAQDLSAGATAGSALIFFEPSSLTLPPALSTNLWVTVDKPLAFADIEVTFDPSKLTLTALPVLDHPLLTTVPGTVTPGLANINANGKITLRLGVNPTALTSSPTGTFKLATLNFSPNTALTNAPSTLAINSTTTQLVDNTATPFVTTFSPANFTLNPPSSSPSTSPLPLTSPSPSPSPLVTVMSDASPTPSPSANLAGDTTPPKITLKVYQIIWTFLSVRVTDTSGINSISIRVNNGSPKICTNSFTCKFGWKPKKGTTYNFVVTATDKSPDHNRSTTTHTIKY